MAACRSPKQCGQREIAPIRQFDDEPGHADAPGACSSRSMMAWAPDADPGRQAARTSSSDAAAGPAHPGARPSWTGRTIPARSGRAGVEGQRVRRVCAARSPPARRCAGRSSGAAESTESAAIGTRAVRPRDACACGIQERRPGRNRDSPPRAPHRRRTAFGTSTRRSRPAPRAAESHRRKETCRRARIRPMVIVDFPDPEGPTMRRFSPRGVVTPAAWSP